ncbi:MAG: 1,4-dihydroxy-2-naphthoate octaprenyltransferase [Flavobacteriaceae bacterium]|jgi:1,4-dihydroxy-2-naphthoate octaprenyltransferase|nr:1,4-dihydroxy-2-naphthoate octaprenyltransferase [Flavobacteriaceae bacterium]
MKKLGIWISACRLRTLPLSISGAIVGSGIAYSRGFFDGYVFAFTILTTLSFQILSNLANDYGDGVKGTDNENRIGPERALQSGDISPKQMRNAIIFNVMISLFLAGGLIYIAFGSEQFVTSLVFMLLGLLAIIAAIKYTVGTSAYGYKALGDVMVFLFFGWLSVLGTYFLYSKQIDFLMLLPASSIGLLSAGVLNLNNMRDIESDKLSNKHTLAGYFGSKNAKTYHLVVIIVALALIGVYSFLSDNNSMYFVFIAFVPLLLHLNRVIKTNTPLEYDPQLKTLALSTFLLAIVFSVCHILT